MAFLPVDEKVCHNFAPAWPSPLSTVGGCIVCAVLTNKKSHVHR